MTKKVIGLVASPRKVGNTDVLVRKILEGAASKEAETELINMYNLDIKMCTACDYCQEMNKCILDDDIGMLIKVLKEKDAIVIGTPVYWWGPSGMLKVFMDRWHNPELRESIRGKKIIIAVTMGDTDSATARHTAGMLNDALEYVETDILETIVAMDTHSIGDILSDEEILKKGYKAGTKI